MILCAKFYFSAQMATMAIGNANPGDIPCRSEIPKVHEDIGDDWSDL